MTGDSRTEAAKSIANRAGCAYCSGNHDPERTNQNDEPGNGTWVHYNVNPPSGARSENAEAQICLASAEIEKAWATLFKQDDKMTP